MDWPHKTTLEFLNYYEREPIIWNTSLPNHRHRNEVYNAWKRIEKRMGKKFSIRELRKKKDSLMASYRNYLNRVKDSMRNGLTESIYKPQWFAYSKMDSFLKDKDKPIEINPEEPLTLEKYENDDCHEEETTNSPESGDFIITDIENDGMVTPEFTIKPPVEKKRKLVETEELKDKLNNAYCILESSVKKSTEKRQVCDIYGELVAAKLRSMDEYEREICMHRIDNILFEMKLKFIKPFSNYHMFYPNQYLTVVTSPKQSGYPQFSTSSQQDFSPGTASESPSP